MGILGSKLTPDAKPVYGVEEGSVQIFNCGADGDFLFTHPQDTWSVCRGGILRAVGTNDGFAICVEQDLPANHAHIAYEVEFPGGRWYQVVKRNSGKADNESPIDEPTAIVSVEPSRKPLPPEQRSAIIEQESQQQVRPIVNREGRIAVSHSTAKGRADTPPGVPVSERTSPLEEEVAENVRHSKCERAAHESEAEGNCRLSDGADKVDEWLGGTSEESWSSSSESLDIPVTRRKTLPMPVPPVPNKGTPMMGFKTPTADEDKTDRTVATTVDVRANRGRQRAKRGTSQAPFLDVLDVPVGQRRVTRSMARRK